MDSIKAYWRRWLWCDVATRIITVNTIVWIVIAAGLLLIPQSAHQWWIGLFGMPASIFEVPSRIWTVGAYMISQYDFLHLLVNMLWLLLFGRLLSMIVDGDHTLGVYVLSGLAGAGAFLAASTAMGAGQGVIIGSSCAVIGVMGAVLVLAPHLRVNLLLLGSVKILWITLAGIVLFVITQPGWTSAIAHGGGLLCGLAYGMKVKRSDDIIVRIPAQKAADNAGAAPRPVPQPVTVPRPKPQQQRQPLPDSPVEIERQLDTLLDKVNTSGYASLTAAERQRLFDLSQRITRK